MLTLKERERGEDEGKEKERKEGERQIAGVTFL